MVVSKASQTSYLEVLQNVLVENVFNIHGLLTVIVGGAMSFCSLYCLSDIFWQPKTVLETAVLFKIRSATGFGLCARLVSLIFKVCSLPVASFYFFVLYIWLSSVHTQIAWHQTRSFISLCAAEEKGLFRKTMESEIYIPVQHRACYFWACTSKAFF